MEETKGSLASHTPTVIISTAQEVTSQKNTGDFWWWEILLLISPSMFYIDLFFPNHHSTVTFSSNSHITSEYPCL